MGLFNPFGSMLGKVAGKMAGKASTAMANKGVNQKFSDFASGKIAGMGGGGWQGGGLSGMAEGLTSALSLAKGPTPQVSMAQAPVSGAGSFGSAMTGGGGQGPSFAPDLVSSASGLSGAGGGPGYLATGGDRAGAMSMDWLQQAFGQLNNQVGLSQQLGEIENAAQGRIDQLAHQGGPRGSALAPAFNLAIQRDADKQKSTATAADQDRRLQQGMQLSQLISGAVTNPLIDMYGIQQGAADAKANRELQKDLQPEAWEKVLGGVASVICWVAREVLPERWQEARAYMLLEAPSSLVTAYMLDGERLARNLTPADRVELRPVFEAMADRGRKYLEV